MTVIRSQLLSLTSTSGFFKVFDNIIFEEPFNASLFVEIPTQMRLEDIEKINDLIYNHSLLQMKKSALSENKTKKDVDNDGKIDINGQRHQRHQYQDLIVSKNL